MDRWIIKQKKSSVKLLKEFEYLDLFPYTIALLLALGEVYIITSFIAIAHKMHY